MYFKDVPSKRRQNDLPFMEWQTFVPSYKVVFLQGKPQAIPGGGVGVICDTASESVADYWAPY